jgi:hypothetical protein
MTKGFATARPAPLIARLKTDLAALGAATEVGFEAGGAEVERLKALSQQLEALNPTPEPARAAALLRGRWHLIYSSFGLLQETTLAALSFGTLPRTNVRVVEIFQEMDPATGHYDNIVQLEDADGAPASLVIEGDYQVKEDRRIDVLFSRVLLVGAGRRMEVALDNPRVPPIATDISFLDDGFRLQRGANGSLYILERHDPTPLRWGREG